MGKVLALWGQQFPIRRVRGPWHFWEAGKNGGWKFLIGDFVLKQDDLILRLPIPLIPNHTNIMAFWIMRICEGKYIGFLLTVFKLKNIFFTLRPTVNLDDHFFALQLFIVGSLNANSGNQPFCWCE
jgi:hypothetical protein